MRVSGVLVLILMVLLSTLSVPDVIRVHVVANSDSEYDQQLKELVKDEVVARVGPALNQLDFRQAESFVVANRAHIAEIGREVLDRHGVDYDVAVCYSVESYPLRLYGNILVPAGRYRSLQVVIGEGAGRNWWCMLFPPLCLVEEVTDTGDSNVVGDGGDGKEVRVRFWLLELLGNLLSNFRGDSDE